MKKFTLSALSLLLVFSIVLFVSFSKNDKNLSGNSSENQAVEIVNVSNSQNDDSDNYKILESRFLNILNHNFAYGEDLYYFDNIVNRSVLALLSLKEFDSFISESYVSDYIYNMYGIEDIDYSAINVDCPKMEGYVYISPVGYETFTHKLLSIEENEDGTFTVMTKVKVETHDSSLLVLDCETLFVQNPSSQFGFNIVTSDFVSDVISA